MLVVKNIDVPEYSQNIAFHAMYFPKDKVEKIIEKIDKKQANLGWMTLEIWKSTSMTGLASFVKDNQWLLTLIRLA